MKKKQSVISTTVLHALSTKNHIYFILLDSLTEKRSFYIFFFFSKSILIVEVTITVKLQQMWDQRNDLWHTVTVSYRKQSFKVTVTNWQRPLHTSKCTNSVSYNHQSDSDTTAGSTTNIKVAVRNSQSKWQWHITCESVNYHHQRCSYIHKTKWQWNTY